MRLYTLVAFFTECYVKRGKLLFVYGPSLETKEQTKQSVLNLRNVNRKIPNLHYTNYLCRNNKRKRL